MKPVSGPKRYLPVRLTLVCLVACAHAQTGRTVDMDQVVIRAGNPKDLPTDVYDAETVLHYAKEAERAQDFAKAKRLYQRLLDEFPKSKLERAAKFGLGRAVEGVSGCGEAVKIFAPIRKEDPDVGDPQEWIDVHFREAACMLSLQRAGEAVDIMTALIGYPSMTKTDRLEALVGRGIANKDRNELTEAEKDLIKVFSLDRDKGLSGQEPETRFTVAKAAYHLGEVYRLRFEQAVLEFPQAVLEARLEEKSQHLLRAQAYFLRAIRMGSLEMAAASGFRVGGMYEKFYQQLIVLQTPPELTASQAKLYMSELRLKIAILLRKAVKIYDEAVAMAKRTGLKSDWIEKAAEAVDRIKKTYLVDISS